MPTILLAFALLCTACDGESTPDAQAASPPNASPPPPVSAPPANPSPAAPPLSPGPGEVLLDGELRAVHWDDGDTFSWQADGRRVRARLSDYNTLESYGPVHRWGTWSYEGLLGIAKEATEMVRRGGWTCSRTGKGGGYGRVAVRCPGVAKALISAGLAHVFVVGGKADPALLAAQADAVAARRGMWAKGSPVGLITSLHSADESGRKPEQIYDRVASVVTGAANPVAHGDTYAPCQEVCRGDSCMRYIPYARRYGKGRLICPVTKAGKTTR